MIRRGTFAVLIVAFATLFGFSDARAQSNFGPCTSNCRFVTVNVTGAAGYQIGGANAIKFLPNITYNEGVIIGPRAGASIPNINSYGLVGIGPDVYRFLTTPGIEGVCIGAFGCEFLADAYGTTAVGEHVIGFDNPAYTTALGNDVMRDTMNGSNNTVGGAASFVDGLGHDNTVWGTLSLHGAAGSIIVTGTPTTGDVLKVSFATTNPNVVNMPGSPCSYTVLAGDTTTALIALHLSSAVGTCMQNVTQHLPDGNTTFTENGVRFGMIYGNPTNVFGFHFPGSQTTGWAITPTTSCTGTCTEILTVQDASLPSDTIVIGSKSMNSVALQTPLQSILMGDSTFNQILAGFQQQIVVGQGGTGQSLQTGSNGLAIGVGSVTNATVLSYSVILGSSAATGATNLINDVIIGAQPNSRNCVTTAQLVIEIGTDACVPSTTANGGMSIGNAIYGTNLTGRNAYSTGQIGILTQAPNATLTIGDAGGTATQGAHVGVLQTTAPTIANATLDARASDVGGTLILTAANPVVTFKVPFQTTPHCVVSSPSGTVLPYSKSTAALTITGGAVGNTVDYVCIQ